MSRFGSVGRWVNGNIIEPVIEPVVEKVVDKDLEPAWNHVRSCFDDDVIDHDDRELNIATGDGLINDWKQTTEGNCVSVAVIKAAIDKYGSDMFAEIQSTENGWNLATKAWVFIDLNEVDNCANEQNSPIFQSLVNSYIEDPTDNPFKLDWLQRRI